jgi:formylglycine-generating enzyme required for sulfatase activity
MGNSEKENASPAHAVTLSNFFLAETPVTQALWREVMNQEGDYQPLIEANFAGENHPIVHVSWEDAQVFIQRLNERVGKETSYTLPTEAQWEYAAREGKAQTSQNISGVDDNKFPTTDYPLFAHYGQTETNWYPIAVKVKEPNSLGLYGMSGNVWDWCADVFKPNAIAYRRNAQNNLNPKVENIEGQPVLNTRVIRGGAYNSNDKGSVFLWFRFSKDASTQAKFISFRLCRNV